MHFAARHVDLGLVVQFELLVLQRPAQVALERQALAGGGIHLAGKELVIAASHFLGVVHRAVRVAHQLAQPGAVIRVQADADADRHVLLLAFHFQRQAQCVQDLLRDVGRDSRLGEGAEQHHEFVAAEAGHRILRANRLLQALGHGLQQLVAVMVAEAVVDGLEPVEVEKHQRKTLAGTIAGGNRLGDAVFQQAAVGQPRQAVVQRQVMQLLVGQAERAHQHRGAGGKARVHHRQQQRDGQQRDRRQPDHHGQPVIVDAAADRADAGRRRNARLPFPCSAWQ